MSPRTNEENERIRQESKSKIMAAALELFANNGYHNTSISKVAKQAGVSKGLMYNYFESKEDLLKEVAIYTLEEGMDIGEDLMQESMNLPPKELLKQIIEWYFELLLSNKEKWKLTLSLTMQVGNIPSIHKLLLESYDVMLKQLEAIFILNGFENAWLEAKLFGATFDGIAAQYVLFGDDYNLIGIKETLIHKYCD